jgi:beta-galactosidase/beta-glucuronidase
VHLVHVGGLHIVHDGLFAPPEFDPLDGVVQPTAELQRVGGAGGTAVVRFTLLDGSRVLATNTSAPVVVGGAPAIASARLTPAAGALRRWSISDPAMYSVRAECFAGDAAAGAAADTQEVAVGFRTTAWSGDDGFALNGAPMRFRGFSHHNSIGGLGVAIPERVDLFRVQAARALGSNVWRMSLRPARVEPAIS